MKMYDPKKKCSFIMQFGFRHPDWKPKTPNIYIKKADRKNDSNLAKLNE